VKRTRTTPTPTDQPNGSVTTNDVINQTKSKLVIRRKFGSANRSDGAVQKLIDVDHSGK
jgi:hypothetical protein